MRLDAPLSGESALIERIAARAEVAMPLPKGFAVQQAIGDDTAVIQANSHTLLWTSDMLVEGVHFRLGWIDPASLGWKALAVNLSDIAAMGGVPVGALLSIALTPEATGAWLDAFLEGWRECAQTYGVALLGGDTNRASQITVDVSVLGMVEGAPVLRKGARAGDWMLVTGALGASRAGLEALLAGESSRVDLTPHFRPVPRLQAGQLARQLGATAMMDLSDGLAADLPKLLRASGKGAVVHLAQLPVHPEAIRWAHYRGIEPALFAYAGGEDYELLITAPPDVAQQLLRQLPQQAGVPITAIGEVIDAPELWLEYPDGRRESPTLTGWDHFR
ncbi:MAG: thiamine-phosphate kinase [Fimbriimonadales bacterium]|nr:thiamine-phosphate kinase [Fimbriimonadales bacterium]MDW8051233.1 thiamine-phosphate kinase [Armatimonadota bacterium]